MAEQKNQNEHLNVEDALTQSEAFLVKYKNAIIGGVVAVIIIVAGFIMYKNLALFQQSVLYQHIQVDEIGIPGVGGKALIGGVAIAGGAQGQHLPAVLPGGVEKIGKVIGGLAQSPDAVRRRQGKYRHQNAAATIHMSVNSLIRKMLCFFSPSRLLRPRP